MTYAPTIATGNGAQVDFSFTFPYLSQLHVKVTVNAVPTTAFTFFSASIIRFDTAPANGAEVAIFRETPTDDLSTVIQPGSALPVDGLNNNFLQSLYAGQEVAYSAANQSTAGLQAQITAANNNASAAVTTANAADAKASGLAGSIATANSNASAAVSAAGTATDTANDAQAAANAALSTGGGTMTGQIIFVSGQAGLSRPNIIHNDSFKINQRRYINGTPTTSYGQYTIDRWRVVVQGQSLSWSTTGGIRTLVVPPGGLEQVIEGNDAVAGTYVANWVGNTNIFIGGAQRFKGVPFTLPGGSEVTVELYGGTVSQLKLEYGDTPTPWVPRTRSDEFLQCARFYLRPAAINFNSNGSGDSSTQGFIYTFPTEMRAAPVPFWTAATAQGNLASFNIDSATKLTARIILFSVGAGNISADFDGINNYIDFDAEF